MLEGRHAELLTEGITADGEAFRALLDGDPVRARAALRRATARYRASWEAAPPRAYGRLVAMLKSAALAGDAEGAAADAGRALDGVADSPTSAYAAALVALVQDHDDAARAAAATMREGDGAFARAADAIVALADRDRDAYGAAVAAIVDDFAGRDQHLTGVPVADTAMLMEALAARRGMAARPSSPLMPDAP